MEGEAVASILKVLVQNLIDHTKSEISLIGGLDKDAAKLAGSLDTIQQFLNDAEMRRIPGGAVKSWLNKLEDAAFDADNVLDELNYHLLSKQINPIKPLKEKVLSCFSPFSHTASRRSMALRIREINENLESINREATDLGLVGRLAAHVPTLVGAAFETDSFTDDPIFIGRDDIVSELVGILTDNTTTGDKVSILAIVGMGGLGKTTLTRKVFHHLKEETKFGSHIWVHVSQIFDPITLFKKILKELTSYQVEGGSRQEILKKLEEALKNKTYLLVLDDVWNEDLAIWEDFIKSLLGVTSTKGSAIVVTTRSMKVASTVNPIYTSQLRGLSEEVCWSIIKAKSFGNKDCPSEYEAIGRKIAKRCQGLPLAANVVGGVLRNMSEEKWLSIEEKWLSRDDGDGIANILRLSFDNLSQSLKKCFAYCSIFPKGREIRRQTLIECWMAEGFLQDDQSGDMESAGDTFINVLVQNSLLQDARRDYYGDIQVCMHDLVHDLASSVLTSSNNVDGTCRVRYMTHEDQSSSIPKEVAKYLRTLFFEGEISGDDMLSNLECLHVLAFRAYKVIELPSSIRKMIHLRRLDISATTIEYIPDWIGELFHLQTLRVDTSSLRKLPCSIKYLVNLRHLYIDHGVELPVGIGGLTSLRTLTHEFTVGNKNGCKVEELGSLNNLKGKLDIDKLERVGDKEEAKKANLYKKPNITSLWLTWDADREGETRNDENVLEGLQPHPNLEELAIWGFKGKIFPAWSKKMTVRDGPRSTWEPLNKLMMISLLECHECEEIPMLGHLPNLKSLRLRSLSSVKCIKSSFYGVVSKETRIIFPALEDLWLSRMRELVEWEEVELSEVKNVFLKLRNLAIHRCNKIMSAPTHFPSSLDRLEIHGIGCYMTLANISLKLTSLSNLWLEELEGLECLPDWLFYNNPNLSKLDIRNCSNLRELPAGLCNLKYLDITNCPNLRELPDGLCNLKYLEKLIVRSCPNLEQLGDSGREESEGSLRHLEIDGCPALVYLPCEMIGSSLEVLYLRYLSSLKNLPSLIDSLIKSPRLTELEIIGVPEFMATYRVEKWPFLSLQKLAVDVSIGGSMETVDSMLQACRHSLGWLRLKGMDCQLPESIQHLTAITLLKLENFGMEEIPEWLGNLSSLRLLFLFNCKELKRLPSLDAMRRLTELTTIEIAGCPEYRIDKQQSDSEWPKISHISYIRVNGINPNARTRVDSVERRGRKDLCLSRCL